MLETNIHLLETNTKDECFFNCTFAPCDRTWDILVKEPSCLLDCFPEKEDECIISLLNDVIRKGVCNVTNINGYDWSPGIYPQSEFCESSDEINTLNITKGTCSDETEALLLTYECLQSLMKQQEIVVDTLLALIFTSCRRPVVNFYSNFFF